MKINRIVKKHVLPVVVAASVCGSSLTCQIVNAENDSNSIVVEAEERTNSSKLFNTVEEAQSWINSSEIELREDYEIVGKQIYEYKGEELKKETILIDEMYDTEEEVLSRLEELKSNEDSLFSLNITKVKLNEEIVETINIDKLFDTMEELEKYKYSLKEKNNLNLTINILFDGFECGKEVNICNITKDSIEDLVKEINIIKDEICRGETDNIKYNIRVETNESEILISSSITKENYEETFETQEQVQGFINDKNDEVIDDLNKQYEFEPVTERIVFSHNDVTEINKTFINLEELYLYKATLEQIGYTLSNLEIIKVTDEENSIVYKLLGEKIIPIYKTLYDLKYSLNTRENITKKTYSASIYKEPRKVINTYNLVGTYEDMVIMETTKYNIKGEITKTIYDKKYKAEISYINKSIEETKKEDFKFDNNNDAIMCSLAIVGTGIGLIGVKNKVKKKKIK